MMYLMRVCELVAITALGFVWGSQNCHSDFGQSSCPGTWQEWGGSSYQVIADATLYEAHSVCQAIGGDVIAPRSIGESDFMAGLAHQEMGSHGYLLIPCSHVEDAGWLCAGQNGGGGDDDDDDDAIGRTNFRNWDSDEPKLAFPANCVEIPLSGNDYKWVVVPCGHRHGAICVRSELCSRPTFTLTRSQNYCLVSNKCLMDHVTEEFMTSGSLSCAFACNRNPTCRSFNEINTKKGQICQLNNATRYEDPRKFQHRFVCVYKEGCKPRQTLSSVSGSQHDVVIPIKRKDD